MAKSVFEFQNYHRFLKHWIEHLPYGGRGAQSQLARSLKCHSTYISSVFREKADLSPEQAFDFCKFANLAPQEVGYFLKLVNYSRAGTVALKAQLHKEIIECQKKNFDLCNRLVSVKSLPPEDQGRYYSAWYFTAIHMALGVPGFERAEDMVNHFGLPLEKVHEVLTFLEYSRLMVRKNGHFSPGETQIHLTKDSPFLFQHHQNWRNKTISALDSAREEDFHYTSVVSMGFEDEVKVRALLVEVIEQIRLIVSLSKEEAVFYYGVDLFPVSFKK